MEAITVGAPEGHMTSGQMQPSAGSLAEQTMAPAPGLQQQQSSGSGSEVGVGVGVAGIVGAVVGQAMAGQRHASGPATKLHTMAGCEASQQQHS